MKPQAFYALAVATLLMVVAAIVAVALQGRSEAVVADRVPAFPDLVERINEVAEITVTTAAGSFTVTGSGDEWRMVEKNGYRVPRERVRDAVLDLANLRLVEAKTARPELFERLQVQAPDEADARSRGVVVRDGQGNTLAEGTIGRRKYFLYVDGRNGTYLRRAGEQRAWLAEGEVNMPAAAVDWLDRVVVDVRQNEVKDFTIFQPDGASLHVFKDSPDAEHFTVRDFPAGAELKTETEADRLALAIAKLELEDVRPLAEVDFDRPLHRAVYRTWDGLELTVEAATLAAEQAATPGPRADSEEAGEEVWIRVRAALADEVPDESREAAAQRVEEINARTGAWAYRVDELDAKRLRADLATIIKGGPA